MTPEMQAAINRLQESIDSLIEQDSIGIKIIPERLYDKKDIAEMWKCSTRTIENRYGQGLPKHIIGDKNYTYGHEINAWVKTQTEIESTPSINPKLEKYKSSHIKRIG